MIPDKFRNIPYIEGGRDFNGADCYGVIRLWLLYRNVVDLPEWGSVISKRRTECAAAYNKTVSGFISVTDPQPDDIITCHNIAGDLEHIGAVVDSGTGLAIYHSTKDSGRPTVMPINVFRRLYKRTEFLRYAHSKRI